MQKNLSLPPPIDEIIQKLCYLKAEVNELDAIVTSIIISQAEKISELENWVDPYSSDGDAICNFWEGNYD